MNRRTLVTIGLSTALATSLWVNIEPMFQPLPLPLPKPPKDTTTLESEFRTTGYLDRKCAPYLSRYLAFPPDYSTKTVLFFGDSNTWFAEFPQILDLSNITTRAIPGLTSVELQRLLPTTLNSSGHPTTVYLNCGINDICYGESDERVVASNILQLAKQFSTNHIHSVIQTILPVTSTYPEAEKVNREVFLVNQILKSSNLEVLDLEPVFGLQMKDFLVYDGMHFNGKGLQLWTSAIRNHLKGNRP